MTRYAAIAALLALAACGGSEPDPQPDPWQRPVVDPDRLGVACPAPDVPILIDQHGNTVAAGDLAPDTMIRNANLDWSEVDYTEVIPGAVRFRLTLVDGRTGMFTPDHAFILLPDEFTTSGGVWTALLDLLPGDWIGGVTPGQVASIEAAPDGDVVRIVVKETTTSRSYTNLGLYSLAHNAATVRPR